MAIESVERQFHERSGSQDLQGKITTTTTYEVVFGTIAEANEQNAALATDPLGSLDVRKNVQRFGQAHPDIPGCYVNGVKPECSDESPFIWYVKLEYSSSPDFPQPHAIDSEGQSTPSQNQRQQQPQNPTQRQATWEVGSVDRSEPVRDWVKINLDGSINYYDPPNWFTATAYKANDYVKNAGNVYLCIKPGTSAAAPTGEGQGDGLVTDGVLLWQFMCTYTQSQTDPSFALMMACVNSGGCPFDPPGMTEVSIPTFRITKYLTPELNFVAYVARMKNAVNKTKWKGLKPRCAKLLSISFQSATVNDVDCVSGTWEVGIDPDTWDVRLLDAGYGAISTKSVANPLYPGTPGEPQRINKRVFYEHKDPDGVILSGPVPMDGRGNPLEPDAQPVFLRGVPRQQKMIDFNTYIPW